MYEGRRGHLLWGWFVAALTVAGAGVGVASADTGTWWDTAAPSDTGDADMAMPDEVGGGDLLPLAVPLVLCDDGDDSGATCWDIGIYESASYPMVWESEEDCAPGVCVSSFASFCDGDGDGVVDDDKAGVGVTLCQAGYPCDGITNYGTPAMCECDDPLPVGGDDALPMMGGFPPPIEADLDQIRCLRSLNECIDDCLDDWFQLFSLDTCTADCNAANRDCEDPDIPADVNAAYGDAANIVIGGLGIVGDVAVDLGYCATGAAAVVWTGTESTVIYVTDADFGDYSIADKTLNEMTDACLSTALSAGVFATAATPAGGYVVGGAVGAGLLAGSYECIDVCINSPDELTCRNTCQNVGKEAFALLVFVGGFKAIQPKLPPGFLEPKAFGTDLSWAPFTTPARGSVPEEEMWDFWQDGGSKPVNEYLRGEWVPEDHMAGIDPADIPRYIEAMDSHISARGVEVCEDAIVYRGDAHWGAPADGSFFNPRFSCTSIDPSVADAFGPRQTIRLPAGTKVAPAPDACEGEVVLPRGGNYVWDAVDMLWVFTAPPAVPPVPSPPSGSPPGPTPPPSFPRSPAP